MALALIAAFFLARSAGLAEPAPSLWGLLAAGIALVNPVPAAIALGFLGPFEDWPLLSSQVGGKAVLVGALVSSVSARAAVSWWRNGRDIAALRESPPLFRASVTLAFVLIVGTGLGVVHSLLRFGPAFGTGAAALWATGIGTALGVYLVSVWLGWHAEWRPLIAAAAGAVVAGAIGLLQEWAPAVLPGSPLAWMITPGPPDVRLASVLDNPNASGMLMIVPLALIVAVVLFRPPGRRMVNGLLLAVPAIVAAAAAVLTYSRSTLVAGGLVAAAFAWRLRRTTFIVAVALIALVLAVALRFYLEIRPDLSTSGVPLPPEFVTRGDALRLGGWSAAVRMFLDAPLIGHGFRSFAALHGLYGEATLDAPHNEWLRFFAEEGVLVGVAALGFLAITLVALWRGRDAVSVASFGIFLAYAAMASFNNPLNYAQLNICVFTVVGGAVGLTWWRLRASVARLPA